MKRIILTESQYKKLVSQPLNEQKDKGGELIFADGYSFDDLTSEMILFLNKLLTILRVKYKKSVYIKKVKNHILTINLSKYNKKQIKTIKYISERYFNSSEFLDDRYDNEKGEMFFAPDFYKLDKPEEIEDITIDDPEEIEDITIDDPEEIEDEIEESEGECELGDCINDRGVYRYENGDVYDGIFVNGKLDVGTYTYENGDVYEGVFENDVFNGEGTFIDIETGRKDYGMWEDGELNGEVSITHKNLDVYEGGWENDTMNGDGKYLWDNGNEYDGEWRDGERNGQGKFTFADPDGRIFEGIFEEDRFKDGTIKFPSGEEVNFEDFHVVVDDTDEEIEEIPDEEIEEIPDEETEIEISDEEDETEIEIIPGCECCTPENVNFYQNNIINLKESNDFRWWVHQDEDRLKKVNDKLKECDYEDGLSILYNVYNNVSPYMIISFDEVGQEWIDDGKPERPKTVYTTKNGNLDSSKLTQIMNDNEGRVEYLSNEAAIQFNKMVIAAKEEDIDIEIADAYRPCGEPGDYFRNKNGARFTQWAAWETYKKGGNLAAKPTPNTGEKWIKNGGGKCSSHHGWGNAVDFVIGVDGLKNFLDTKGKDYGFYKIEGHGEAWHYNYCGKDAIHRSSSCYKID